MTARPPSGARNRAGAGFFADARKAACILALAVGLAYSGSLNGPFVFDDSPSIVENPAIRSLWPLSRVLATPLGRGDTVAGRPLLQLSLAVNFAISGLSPWSYHVLNLGIHILAALFLLGILRRTLALEKMRASFGQHAPALAFFCALIWALHPLQTESVTYVVQRCESLMGLCFLASLYFALRGWQSARPRPWHLAALAAYAAGMGAKEVIVALPLATLCFDAVFVHQGFPDALRRSRLLYAGLFLGWAPLLALAWSAGLGQDRTGPVPYTHANYILIQGKVLWHYLRLSVLPWPLCVDYGPWAVPGIWEALAKCGSLAGLALLSAWGLFRKKPWGFCGAWFFLILAPTSSFMPLADPAFEHRMYLPLASLAALAVLGGYFLAQKAAARRASWAKPLAPAGLWCAVCLALACGALTFWRNLDWQSEVRIWKSAAEARPGNYRTHLNLGDALEREGRHTEAMRSLVQAWYLNPQEGMIFYNMGLVWQHTGALASAETYFRKAIALLPDLGKAYVNLGGTLMEQGRLREAAEVLSQAVAMEPDSAKAHNSLGAILDHAGLAAEAGAHFQKALELDPGSAKAWFNMGALLDKQGHPQQAAAAYQKALKLDPAMSSAYYNMGNIMAGSGRYEEALAHYGKALSIQTKCVPAMVNMGIVLGRMGQTAEAMIYIRRALALDPQNAPARAFLAETGAKP